MLMPNGFFSTLQLATQGRFANILEDIAFLYRTFFPEFYHRKLTRS